MDSVDDSSTDEDISTASSSSSSTTLLNSTNTEGSTSSSSSGWSDSSGWSGSSGWSQSEGWLEPPLTFSEEKRDYEFGKRRLPRDFDFSQDWSPKKRRKFFKLIGCTRETFLDLHEETKEYLPLGASTNGMSITPMERLLYFLKFFRKSEVGDNAAYSNDMSEGAVIENNTIVIEALNPRNGPNFCKRHIFLPDTAKAQWEAVQFMETSGMPPLIVGAIDGFHVRVSVFLLLNHSVKNIHVFFRLNLQEMDKRCGTIAIMIHPSTAHF